jgi:hypothetical protein
LTVKSIEKTDISSRQRFSSAKRKREREKIDRPPKYAKISPLFALLLPVPDASSADVVPPKIPTWLGTV